MNTQTQILLVALLGTAIVPELLVQDIPVREVEGVNSYATHRGFFGEHTVGQTLRWPGGRISAVGVWLGHYVRHEQPRGDVILRIRESPTGPVLRESRLATSVLRLKELNVFRFPPIPDSSGKTLTLELHAPNIPMNGALGARTDPNPNAEPTGTLHQDGQAKDGDLAFRLMRRGGLWSKLAAALQKDRSLRIRTLQAAGAASVFVLFAWILETVVRRARRPLLTEAFIIGALLLILLGVRLVLAHDVRAAPPGDPYNFVFILERLLGGRNPYENEKRLPGYPIVLLPSGLFTDDPILAGKVANQIIIVLAAGAAYALARRIGVSPRGALFAATAFSLSRDTLFLPFHPLSYPLFTLQGLLALLAAPFARAHIGRAIILGVILGWMAETRYEGMIIIPLFLLYLLWHGWQRWRTQGKSFWNAFAPSLACAVTVLVFLLPFFAHNLRTYGTPFYSDYLDAPVTNVRRSPEELRTHLGQTHGVFSSFWWPLWRQKVRLAVDTLFWITAAATGVLLAVHARVRRISLPALEWWLGIFAVASVVAVQLLFLRTIEDRDAVWTTINRSVLIAAIAGWVMLLWRSNASRGVFLVGALLAIPPLWVHPHPKNFLHMIPFVALGLGAAFDALLPTFVQATRRTKGMALATSCLAAFALSLPLVETFHGLDGAIEIHNEKYVDDTLLREAAIAARKLVPEGNLGAQHWYLPVGAFFDGSRIRERHIGTKTPLTEWARTNDVRAILWRSNDVSFAEITEHPEQYPILYETRARGEGDEARVVRLYGIGKSE